MRRILVVMLAALLAFPFVATSTVARQGTPEATPVGGECVAPEIPPGTPTPMEDLMGGMGMEDPAATPDGEDHAGMAMDATPAGEDEEGMVFPPAQEPLVGEPVDDPDVIAEVERAVYNLADCLNAGMYVEFASLFTANGLMEECGTTNPYDGEFCYGGTPPIEMLAVENIQIHEDDRLSADATYRMGNMLRAEQFVFVREGDTLLVDTSPDLEAEAPEGATVITGEMVDYAFVLSENSAPAGDLVFDVTNTGEYPHELVVFALPEGVEVEQLFEDESLFEQVQFFGYTYSDGGEDAPPLVLLDMQPGTYTLVCFVDVPEGVPHVMRGMILDFEVTEP